MRKIGLALFLFFTVNLIFAGTEKCTDCGYPVADAGPDKTVVENTPVTLDGSDSYDPEGEEITYRWSAPEDIVLSDTTAIYPTFNAPVVDSVKAYTIILIVNDGQWDSDPDYVVITVVAVNTPPVADAGEDQTVEKFSEVTLNGSGSYDTTSTGVLNFSWTGELASLLDNPTSATPTFIAPDVTWDTQYTFTLVVNDGYLDSDPDTVIITVLGNSPPVSDPGEDQVIAGGATVTLDGSGSYDPEGAELSYRWSAPEGIVLLDSTVVFPTFTAPKVTSTTYYSVELTVNDGIDDSEPYALDLYISEYVETLYGHVNSRYIEIYNGTGSLVDLSYYEVWLTEDCGDWAYFFQLEVEGSLTAGETLIIVQSSAGADEDITEHRHVEWEDLNKMNGPNSNNAIGLINNGNLIDIIGEVGVDPGDGWNVAGVEDATKNHTLVRKKRVVSGNTDWESSAGTDTLDSEWIVYPPHTYEYAGFHKCTACDNEVIITVKYNLPPTANAGSDLSIVKEFTVTLDGSGSYDSTTTGILNYHWTSLDPSLILSDSTAVSPILTAPDVSEDTTYFFKLVVDDGEEFSDPDTVSVTVLANNFPPVADGGSIQIDYEGKEITLDGSGSYDPTNTGILNYHWTSLDSSIILSDTTVANPTFSSPICIGNNTIFEFSLVVDDSELSSDPDIAEVYVRAKYPVAQVVRYGDTTFVEGEEVILDGSGSFDPNNDDITYLWESLSGISMSDTAIFNSDTLANPIFTIPGSIGEDKIYKFTLEVTEANTDTGFKSLPDTVLVPVIARWPVANAGKDQTVTGEIEVTLNGSLSEDPQGKLVSYGVWTDTHKDPKDWVWTTKTRRTFTYIDDDSLKPYDEYKFHWTAPDDIILSDTNAVNPTFISPDVSEDTDYTFTLIVDDSEFNSVENKVTVTVDTCQPPIADASEDRKIYKGDEYTLDGSGSKSRIWTIIDNDTTVVGSLSYQWTAPENIILSDATSVRPTFTAPEISEDTVYVFLLVVCDNANEELCSDADSVSITVSASFFSPPVTPILFARVEDRKVILIWDKTSESSIDSLTGYADFEGYKLYKSTDGGKTWGGPDDILYDYGGEPIGWKPIAQFDLNVEQDPSHCIYKSYYTDCDKTRGIEISGFDPLAPKFNLGDNTGLEYSFIDSNVIDGMEYTYSLTSYDMGIRTYTIEYGSFGKEGTDDYGKWLEGEPDHTFWETMTAYYYIKNGLNYAIMSSFVDTTEDIEYYMLVPPEGITDGQEIYMQNIIWSSSNPDHFSANGSPYKSLESNKGTSSDDENFVTIVPGYYASNITFPDPQKVKEFMDANCANIGTGDKYYTIMNEDSISDALIRFEIQADNKNDQGNEKNIFEGFKTEHPTLYAYEVDTIPVLNRPAAQIPVNWEKEFSFNVDTSGNPETSLDSINIIMDLPGADSSNFSQDSIIRLPEYILEAFPIEYFKEIGYQGNWTDVFHGIRVRFDNAIGDRYRLNTVEGVGTYEAEIEELIFSFADTNLISQINVSLTYSQEDLKKSFGCRPSYEYKIEFSNTIIDTAEQVSGSGCDELPFKGTLLPFKITNLTTGEKVGVVHKDDGWIDKEKDEKNVPIINDDADNDCYWERNEQIALKWETVVKGSDIVTDPYIYDLYIDFPFFDFYRQTIAEWRSDLSYSDGEVVVYAEMIWETTENVEAGIKPTAWFDDDGDSINDNPWRVLYPWEDGDYVIIKPARWYVDGDSWIADLSVLGKSHKVTQDELEEIKVVPNPYIVHSGFETTQTLSHHLRFTHLPQKCRITIYTINGEKVISLDHDNEYDGNEWWDLRTINNQEVAPGLYIYLVEAEGLTHIGKFAVVR